MLRNKEIVMLSLGHASSLLTQCICKNAVKVKDMRKKMVCGVYVSDRTTEKKILNKIRWLRITTLSYKGDRIIDNSLSLKREKLLSYNTEITRLKNNNIISKLVILTDTADLFNENNDIKSLLMNSHNIDNILLIISNYDNESLENYKNFVKEITDNHQNTKITTLIVYKNNELESLGPKNSQEILGRSIAMMLAAQTEDPVNKLLLSDTGSIWGVGVAAKGVVMQKDTWWKKIFFPFFWWTPVFISAKEMADLDFSMIVDLYSHLPKMSTINQSRSQTGVIEVQLLNPFKRDSSKRDTVWELLSDKLKNDQFISNNNLVINQTNIVKFKGVRYERMEDLKKKIKIQAGIYFQILLNPKTERKTEGVTDSKIT